MATKPIIVSVINAKGGVGKTTTTVNLGAALAQHGYKVLLIDMDLQANLTESLIGRIEPTQKSMPEVLRRTAELADIVLPTGTPNLSVAPTSDTMIGIDADLTSRVSGEMILKNCIARNLSRLDVDFILIDNPPYLGLPTINSLFASTHYLIPVSCEYLPMVGIALLQSTIRGYLENATEKPDLLGVLLTMYDLRESITTDVEKLLRQELGADVFEKPIRINTRFKRIPSEQHTIFQSDDKKGAADYEQLATEVLHRLQQRGALLPVRQVANG